jgi:hypothetical protein
MKARHSVGLITCLLTVVLVPATAQAQSTFTQVGTWSCIIPSGTPPGFACPSVTFPQSFGGIPNVIVTGSAQPTNVTAQGFTPVTQQGNTAPVQVGPFPFPVNIPISGTWVAVGASLFKGSTVAKYLVLTVIYAPPGANGGRGASSVSYGSGVTSGTTTSASQSFQSSIGTSVTAKGGFLGSGGEGSLSFDFTNKATDTQSLEIKQSTTSTITRPGPSQDGIDHNQDVIYLLLKPTISLSLSSSAAAWTFGDNSQSPIQYVFVGELNGSFPWRPGVQQQLNAAGVTAADYPIILANDPLANGGTPTLDPARFRPANTMFPYEPPATQNDPVISINTTISNSSTSTTGSAIQNTYKVGMSISGDAGLLDMAKLTLKDTLSWEWTNTSSTSTSSGSTQTASLTIGGPAYGYTGVTEVAVYTDTLFNTFAFALVPPSHLEVAVQGTLKATDGAPSAKSEVVLTENGVKHRTFTNAKGEYIFFGHLTGPATVEAKGMTQIVPQPQPSRTLNLELR